MRLTEYEHSLLARAAAGLPLFAFPAPSKEDAQVRRVAVRKLFAFGYLKLAETGERGASFAKSGRTAKHTRPYIRRPDLTPKGLDHL